MVLEWIRCGVGWVGCARGASKVFGVVRGEEVLGFGGVEFWGKGKEGWKGKLVLQ